MPTTSLAMWSHDEAYHKNKKTGVETLREEFLPLYLARRKGPVSVIEAGPDPVEDLVVLAISPTEVARRIPVRGKTSIKIVTVTKCSFLWSNLRLLPEEEPEEAIAA